MESGLGKGGLIKFGSSVDFSAATCTAKLYQGASEVSSTTNVFTCNSGSNPVYYVTAGSTLSANTWYELRITFSATAGTNKLYETPLTLVT